MDEIFFAVRMTLPLPSSEPASARIMPSLETQDHAMEDVVMVKLSVVDKSGLLLDRVWCMLLLVVVVVVVLLCVAGGWSGEWRSTCC